MDIHEILRERILVLDGAMGTVLQSQELTADDFGGPHYEGCNEYLNLTRPDVVQSIHTAYLEAGADIIMLDNMKGDNLKQTAKTLKQIWAGKRTFLIESSGGISEENIVEYFSPGKS